MWGGREVEPCGVLEADRLDDKREGRSWIYWSQNVSLD